MRIGVIGALGAVGTTLTHLLETRNFPLSSLRLFGSSRSSGKSIFFQETPLQIEELSDSVLHDFDLLFFCAGSAVSKQFIPLALERNIQVIDSSSAFRMNPEVPLVIPEINPCNPAPLIASPNCATTLMLMALFPLHQHSRLKKVILSTYQAASGAGQTAVRELIEETTAFVSQKAYERTVIPIPYAFNLFLHNQPDEEQKILYESRKILGDPTLEISPTCVRVPVLRAHSESIYAEFHKPISKQQASDLLYNAPGIWVVDGHDATPLAASGRNEILCGRIRQDPFHTNGLHLWIVGDQLLKGAALNAVQIAEMLLGDPHLRTPSALL